MRNALRKAHSHVTKKERNTLRKPGRPQHKKSRTSNVLVGASEKRPFRTSGESSNWPVSYRVATQPASAGKPQSCSCAIWEAIWASLIFQFANTYQTRKTRQ